MSNVNLAMRAFFFNAKTDYLPYYKPFKFTLDKSTKLSKVLELIKQEERNFSYPKENLYFRVNGFVVNGDEELGEVVNKLGSELTIDPLSTYRASNGLVIDDSDFLEQFYKLPKDLQTQENLEYYKTLYPYHYASETFNYKKNYIGDAIILLAHKLIVEESSEYKEEILEVINDYFSGIRYCEYENNIFNGESVESKIEAVKSMLHLKDERGFLDKITSLAIKKRKHDIDSLDRSNIALYIGSQDLAGTSGEIKNLALEAGVKVVDFDLAYKKAGQSLVGYNRDFASLKAGRAMLEAFDSGADLFVCMNEVDLKYFREIQGYSEKVAGRDIELKIISVETLKSLLEGAVA